MERVFNKEYVCYTLETLLGMYKERPIDEKGIEFIVNAIRTLPEVSKCDHKHGQHKPSEELITGAKPHGKTNEKLKDKNEATNSPPPTPKYCNGFRIVNGKCECCSNTVWNNDYDLCSPCFRLYGNDPAHKFTGRCNFITETVFELDAEGNETKKVKYVVKCGEKCKAKCEGGAVMKFCDVHYGEMKGREMVKKKFAKNFMKKVVVSGKPEKSVKVDAEDGGDIPSDLRRSSTDSELSWDEQMAQQELQSVNGN